LLPFGRLGNSEGLGRLTAPGREGPDWPLDWNFGVSNRGPCRSVRGAEFGGRSVRGAAHARTRLDAGG
jgi:hypothetical protein